MWEKITNYESAKITQKRKSLKKLVLLSSSYEQVNDFLEKKLRQYLLIGVWFVIALTVCVHNILECPKCLS